MPLLPKIRISYLLACLIYYYYFFKDDNYDNFFYNWENLTFIKFNVNCIHREKFIGICYI